MGITRAIFHMFLAVTFFAVMNVSVHSLRHIPAHEIVLFRSAVSLLIAVGTLHYKRMFTFGKRIDLLILRGFFGSGALFLFFITVQKMPFATAITIQYLSPVITSIFALFFLREKMAPIQWIAYAVAFAGVAVIKWDDASISGLYLGLGILSAIFSALAYTTIRRMKDSDHPLVVVMYFPLVALPLAGIWCLFDWVTPHGWDWLWLLVTGISAQLGQVFMTKSLVAEKANIVSSVHYLGVIYSILFGVLLFGETYSWMAYVGIALVTVGVLGNLLRRS
jgi:drug/metabolite transporter (DMT)-like permease